MVDFQGNASPPPPFDRSPPWTEPPFLGPLPYATDLPRYGIAFEVDGPTARISVPPPRRLLHLIAELTVPAFMLVYTLAYAVEIPLRAARGELHGFFGLLCSLIGPTFFGVVTYVGVRSFLRSRRRQTVFELSPDSLTIHDHDGAGNARTRSWSRQSLGKILAGPVPWTTSELRGLGLHIHITGKTIVEVMPGHEPKVARWVADRLNEALRSPVGEGIQRTS